MPEVLHGRSLAARESNRTDAAERAQVEVHMVGFPLVPAGQHRMEADAKGPEHGLKAAFAHKSSEGPGQMSARSAMCATTSPKKDWVQAPSSRLLEAGAIVPHFRRLGLSARALKQNGTSADRAMKWFVPTPPGMVSS